MIFLRWPLLSCFPLKNGKMFHTCFFKKFVQHLLDSELCLGSVCGLIRAAGPRAAAPAGAGIA